MDDRRERRREAEERLAAHPGFRAHKEHQAFGTTLSAVFAANFHSLLGLLEQAATEVELGIELVQNVHDDAIRRRFHAEAIRRLHNYVAATMTLVEHSRRLMRGRDDGLAQLWAARRTELIRNGEVPFMIDLRSFIQHRSLPFLAHSVHFDRPNTPEASWESEVELGTQQLLRWDGWKAEARRFLESQGDAIQLRPVVRRHGELVWEANAWLINALQDDNRALLDEANLIVVEINASMLGCSIEEADGFTWRDTLERQRPRPTAPFPEPRIAPD